MGTFIALTGKTTEDKGRKTCWIPDDELKLLKLYAEVFEPVSHKNVLALFIDL